MSWRACAIFLFSVTAILLGACLMPSGSAEDLPSLVVLLPREYTHTNNTTIPVTGITVPNATVSIKVEAILIHASQIYTGTALEDGTFSVVVQLYEDELMVINVTVTDAQNRSSSVTRNVTCDTCPPEFVINKPPTSPFYTNQLNYTIITTNMRCDHIYVAIGGVEVLSTGIAKRTVDLVEGENRIEIRAWEMVGNVISVWVVIVVDITPPQLNVTSPAGTELFTNSSSITLVGNSSGGGPVLVEMDGTVRTAALKRGDWFTGGAWEHHIDLGPVEGTWRIEVRTSDVVGNVAKRWINVTLDWTPPDIHLELETSTRVPRVQVEGTTEEGIDEALIDGVPFSVVHGLFSTVIMSLEHGWNPIVVQLHDPAGNCATKVARVFYSARPPVLHLLDPERFGDDGVRIRGTTDTYVEQVLIDGWSHPVTNGIILVELNDTRGESEFEVTVVDPAGASTDGRAELRSRTLGPSLPTLAVAMALVALIIVLVTILSRMRRGMTRSP